MLFSIMILSKTTIIKPKRIAHHYSKLKCSPKCLFNPFLLSGILLSVVGVVVTAPNFPSKKFHNSGNSLSKSFPFRPASSPKASRRHSRVTPSSP
jgi:hypothetical protein